MKRILFLLALIPSMAQAQVEKKILQMDVVRVAGGTAKVQLDDAEDYVGPILNPSTNKLVLPTTSINRSRIKEIRFEIVTVTVDTTQTSIQTVEALPREDSNKVYDLTGRQLRQNVPARGIYIRNGKKYVKK